MVGQPKARDPAASVGVWVKLSRTEEPSERKGSYEGPLEGLGKLVGQGKQGSSGMNVSVAPMRHEA